MMEQQLSFYRIWKLIRSDFLTEWNIHAYISGIFIVVCCLTSLYQFHTRSVDLWMYQSLFSYVLLIWGLFATSRAFRALHDRTRKEAYLILPASALEKLLARLLPLTLGLGIALPIYFFVLSAAIEMFNLVFYGTNRPLFNPFDSEIYEIYTYYFILQSIFFLGAIWFRRLMLLKTIFTLFVLKIGFALVAIVTFSFAVEHSDFHDWKLQVSYYGLSSQYDYYPPPTFRYLFENLMYQDFEIQIAVICLVLIVLPFVLWWIAWLRLKEAQVSDGI